MLTSPKSTFAKKRESGQSYLHSANPVFAQKEDVIGNIAAGNLEKRNTIPFIIRTHKPLGKGKYVLRINGKSMEPNIMDGSLIAMKKIYCSSHP